MSSRGARILLRVHPGASRNEVVGFSGGVLRIRITAPPVRDKANKELIAFLSQLLRVSPATLIIIQGRTSRNKVIAIEGLSQDVAIKRLWPG